VFKKASPDNAETFLLALLWSSSQIQEYKKKKCRVGGLFCFCFVLYPIGCGDVFYGGFVVILFLLGAKKKQISIFDVTFAINNCI